MMIQTETTTTHADAIAAALLALELAEQGYEEGTTTRAQFKAALHAHTVLTVDEMILNLRAVAECESEDAAHAAQLKRDAAEIEEAMRPKKVNVGKETMNRMRAQFIAQGHITL